MKGGNKDVASTNLLHIQKHVRAAYTFIQNGNHGNTYGLWTKQTETMEYKTEEHNGHELSDKAHYVREKYNKNMGWLFCAHDSQGDCFQET